MHYTLYHRLLSPNISATMWWLIQTCRHQPIEFIFVRDSDGNPVCRHQSSLWILAHTAATSPYQQSQKLRTASISLPPADPCPHTLPASISPECTYTAPAVEFCFLSLFKMYWNACALHLQYLSVFIVWCLHICIICHWRKPLYGGWNICRY